MTGAPVGWPDPWSARLSAVASVAAIDWSGREKGPRARLVELIDGQWLAVGVQSGGLRVSSSRYKEASLSVDNIQQRVFEVQMLVAGDLTGVVHPA